MKQDIESIVKDVNRYSEGLVLALQNDKFKEADEYIKKMKNHLDSIRTYLRMKKKIVPKN